MDISARGYVNPDLLWSPETLHDQLERPNIKIIDTRPAEEFAKSRIPGARHFDLYFVNTYDTDPVPLNSFAKMWADMLGWRGVAETDTIVFYGDFTDMCAARGFWFAEYLGHPDLHVLDGGISAWIKAGLPLGTLSDPPKPTKFKPRLINEKVATREDVLSAIDNPECIIVDNRSHEEFIGTDQRARHGGAIPSARHRDWVDLYDDRRGCMKDAKQLSDAFLSIDAHPDKDIIVYCNTGYRSAHAYLALRLLNYPRVRNYVGSWQEWGNRDDVPIESRG